MRFSIVAGDARNARLFEILTEERCETRLFLASDADKAISYGDVIVLPIKGVDEAPFREKLRSGQTLITSEDFLRSEDFLIPNAIITAEGALEIALREMPRSLFGAKTLTIGYGRIGKILCARLSAFGADVAASARKTEDFCWIESAGYTPIHTANLLENLSGSDLIFNTVPSMILTKELLGKVKPSCVIIDLASKPGGVDFEAAKQLGLNCRWELGLPGKCAPESAARVMRDCLKRIIRERGLGA